MLSPYPGACVVAVGAKPDAAPDDAFTVVAVFALAVVAVLAPDTAAAVVLVVAEPGATVAVAPDAAVVAVASDVVVASAVVVVDSLAPTLSELLLLPPQPAAISPRSAMGT